MNVVLESYVKVQIRCRLLVLLRCDEDGTENSIMVLDAPNKPVREVFIGYYIREFALTL